MFPRFLNNNDYIGIVTEEALDQLIRGNEERLAQAEEAAEQPVLEYLTENYEVEAELAIERISFHIILISHIQLELISISRIRSIRRSVPSMVSKLRKRLHTGPNMMTLSKMNHQSSPTPQRRSYEPGDIVRFGTAYFECLEYNGPDFDDIRVPGVKAWEPVEFTPWEANVDYSQWSVVLYNGKYYTLMVNENNRNLTVNPEDSDDWGQIEITLPTTLTN